MSNRTSRRGDPAKGRLLAPNSWNGTSGQRGPRLGFPREARLVRRGDYEAVYRGGQRRASPQFVIFYCANGLPRSRFGISVKRALGGAVVRNRIRRRVREILRVNRLEIPAGWDIVIHPRAAVARSNFAALAAELLGLLRALATR